MEDIAQPDFDLSEPISRVWSLRSAETPFINGNGQSSYHCFLLLVEVGLDSLPRILDELHFKPITPSPDGEPNTDYEAARRPGTLLLGAEAYTNPKKTLDSLRAIEYVRGTPHEILHLWNNAYRAALTIHNLRRSFQPGDCRAAAKATVESLRFGFQTFPALGIHLGLNTELGAKINPCPAFLTTDRPSLLKDFRDLRETLRAQNLSKATLSNRPELG